MIARGLLISAFLLLAQTASAQKRIGAITVGVSAGDLTQQYADAWVVPHFNGSASPGGVGGAVIRAGGVKGINDFDTHIQAKAAAMQAAEGKVDLFTYAHITESGGALATYLIGVVSVGSGGAREKGVVSQSIYNALVAAKENGNIRKIGIPALGTGIIGQLTDAQSAEAIFNGIFRFSQDHPTEAFEVGLVIYGRPGSEKPYSKVLESGSYKADPKETDAEAGSKPKRGIFGKLFGRRKPPNSGDCNTPLE